MVHPYTPTEPAAAPVRPLPSRPHSPAHFPGLPSNPNIRGRPLPGVRCPTCAANGLEIWVIPGRACGNCGTPCF